MYNFQPQIEPDYVSTLSARPPPAFPSNAPALPPAPPLSICCYMLTEFPFKDYIRSQLRSLNLACDKVLVFSSENVANLLGNSSTDPPLSSIKVYNQSNWLERNWYANMGSALTTILNILLQEDKNETFTTTYDVYVKVDSDTWVHPSYFRRLFDPYAMRLRNEVLSLTVGDDFYGSDSKFDGYFNAHSRKALLYLSPWISRQSCLALEILGGHREVEFEGGAPNGCKEETKEENKMLIPPHLFSLGSRGICDCTV